MPPSYGKVYRVVGDETGKWNVSPDGTMRWGTDPSAGPERIPPPVPTQRSIASVPARDAFGPGPPKIPDPPDQQDPSVSQASPPPPAGGVADWGDRIEYGWPLDPDSPARTKAYIQQQKNQAALSQDSSTAGSLATGQPTTNRSTFTLEEMREIVRRHIRQEKSTP